MNTRAATAHAVSLAHRAWALLCLLAVVLLNMPCANAAAASQQPGKTHPAATMPCCDHQTNVHAPALCCGVHAQPAAVAAITPAIPHLASTALPRVDEPQWRLLAAVNRTTARPPPLLLHPILRI